MKRMPWIPILVVACIAQLSHAKPKSEDTEHTEFEKLELREAHLELDEREADLKERYARGFANDDRLPKSQCRKSPNCGKCAKGHCFPFLIYLGIIHILMSVWVFSDIRKRNAGSGIWVVMALLTGLVGALVYAVVRLGDPRSSQ